VEKKGKVKFLQIQLASKITIVLEEILPLPITIISPGFVLFVTSPFSKVKSSLKAPKAFVNPSYARSV
jgi:hypothetical protein